MIYLQYSKLASVAILLGSGWIFQSVAESSESLTLLNGADVTGRERGCEPAVKVLTVRDQGS